jgi:hypothetical protein
MTSLNADALSSAVDLILASNFDADSKTCLLTLLKLLDNILQKPGDASVRSINLANKAFHNKVASRKGGIDFLLACGFEKTQDTQLLSTVPSDKLVLQSEDQAHLIAARQLISSRLMQQLGCKMEDLPPYGPPPLTLLISGASNDMAFNPFAGQRYDAASAAIGTNLGPDANYVSPTELNLRSLQKQQEAMETSVPVLQSREWIGLVPGQSVPVVSSTTTPTTDVDAPSDSALLAQYMKQQQDARLQREHGGFVTKAMRDLAAIKKQKVYSYCTLTINFPDGMRLVGKFLPDETICDVAQSLREECLIAAASGEFELYQTPPRRLLTLTKSLQDEGLVPAAKVFVSWKDANNPTGDYLKADLFCHDNNTPTIVLSSGQSVTAAAAAKKQAAATAGPDTNKKELSKKQEAMLARMMGGKPGLGGGSKKSSDDATSKPKWFKG